uniref:Uncharacterized protein n=1 Tax=Palpitomonas bilix TaxID=652834 RepID=A0A7S3DBR9_9EUKA
MRKRSGSDRVEEDESAIQIESEAKASAGGGEVEKKEEKREEQRDGVGEGEGEGEGKREGERARKREEARNGKGQIGPASPHSSLFQLLSTHTQTGPLPNSFAFTHALPLSSLSSPPSLPPPIRSIR